MSEFLFFFFAGQEPEDLNQEVDISYIEMKGLTQQFIKSCYGDLFTICNALDDYAGMVEKYMAEHDMEGYSEAFYQYHADRCRKISDKIADQIGYDKIKTLEKCLKKSQKDDTSDIGEEAMALSVKRNKGT